MLDWVQADRYRYMKAGLTGRWVKKEWTGYRQMGKERLDWVQADGYREAWCRQTG
jgi:hypothetical protein